MKGRSRHIAARRIVMLMLNPVNTYIWQFHEHRICYLFTYSFYLFIYLFIYLFMVYLTRTSVFRTYISVQSHKIQVMNNELKRL